MLPMQTVASSSQQNSNVFAKNSRLIATLDSNSFTEVEFNQHLALDLRIKPEKKGNSEKENENPIDKYEIVVDKYNQDNCSAHNKWINSIATNQLPESDENMTLKLIEEIRKNVRSIPDLIRSIANEEIISLMDSENAENKKFIPHPIPPNLSSAIAPSTTMVSVARNPSLALTTTPQANPHDYRSLADIPLQILLPTCFVHQVKPASLIPPRDIFNLSDCTHKRILSCYKSSRCYAQSLFVLHFGSHRAMTMSALYRGRRKHEEIPRSFIIMLMLLINRHFPAENKWEIVQALTQKQACILRNARSCAFYKTCLNCKKAHGDCLDFVAPS